MIHCLCGFFVQTNTNPLEKKKNNPRQWLCKGMMGVIRRCVSQEDNLAISSTVLSGRSVAVAVSFHPHCMILHHTTTFVHAHFSNMNAHLATTLSISEPVQLNKFP